MPTCWQCKAESSTAHHDRVVHNRHELHGPWSGWRMAGRDLVSPDGDRIAPARLQGLLWRQRAEARRDAARARNASRKAGQRGLVTVIRIQHRDWHRERFGSSAG